MKNGALKIVKTAPNHRQGPFQAPLPGVFGKTLLSGPFSMPGTPGGRAL
jgi:hypothetical protein